MLLFYVELYIVFTIKSDQIRTDVGMRLSLQIGASTLNLNGFYCLLNDFNWQSLFFHI